ncbi:MAG: two pore domain potassium channel family protein [Burkholderiales bacterium]|nr:two pore domain potassium channel family protein [Burkholderiales bacterium]
MPLVAVVSLILVSLCTLFHYETLDALNTRLPRLRMPRRRKLLVVLLVAFVAHALETVVYGIANYLLVLYGDVGTITGPTEFSFTACMHHSAETYTSLGYGDFTPEGPIRALAGVEALNGLLLIAWTASFTYLEMERYWKAGTPR